MFLFIYKNLLIRISFSASGASSKRLARDGGGGDGDDNDENEEIALAGDA